MEQKVANISGRCALITGGSRGIGAAIARSLAASGAYVIINFHERQHDAEETLRGITSAGGRGEIIQADVSDPQACESMFRAIREAGKAVDILVNNAGITRDRTLRKMSREDFEDVINTNLMGAVNCTRVVISGMIERRFGRVVNISSIVAQTGAFGQTNYAAAKAGLIGFGRSLAIEVAKYGVTVNAICPGYVRTSMWDAIPQDVQQQILVSIPMQRLAEPEDIAECVRYLAAHGDYITGQTININGGLYRE